MAVNGHKIGFSLGGSVTTPQKIWQARYTSRASQSFQSLVSTPPWSTTQSQQTDVTPLSSPDPDEEFKQRINQALTSTMITHLAASLTELPNVDNTIEGLIDQYVEQKNAEIEGKDQEITDLEQQVEELKGKLDYKVNIYQGLKDSSRTGKNQ